MVLPCQVWFDAEAPEALLDATATTEQHLRTLARPEVRIESPRGISTNSKFKNTRVGAQKVEGESAVRNVTKPTDAAGQPADEGREARPSEADGPVQSVKSSQTRQMDRGEVEVEEEKQRIFFLKKRKVFSNFRSAFVVFSF